MRNYTEHLNKCDINVNAAKHLCLFGTTNLLFIFFTGAYGSQHILNITLTFVVEIEKLFPIS